MELVNLPRVMVQRRLATHEPNTKTASVMLQRARKCCDWTKAPIFVLGKQDYLLLWTFYITMFSSLRTRPFGNWIYSRHRSVERDQPFLTSP
jgi:hypothetical protein